jgi:hypothetical protein
MHGARGIGREIEVVRNLREVIEIVAVHMPGQDAQAARRSGVVVHGKLSL